MTKELPSPEGPQGLIPAVVGLIRRGITTVTRPEQPRPSPIRMLVEGAPSDDWATLHTVVIEGILPPDYTMIELNCHDLTLIGRWTNEGIAAVDSEESKKGPQVIINSDEILFSFQRPATVIAEDGRIFHDLWLLEDGYNRQRLISFLKSLFDRYDQKNPFQDPSRLLPEG